MSSTPLLGDRYRLLDRLGRGGMSVVWRAYDQVLRRTVAVKLLAGHSASAASRERALTEARTAAQLSHPHICQVHDYGEAQTESGDHVAYIVMELVSGATLQERLRAGPMPVGVALRVCAEVASALAVAHSRGMVHRDIKPANVMLTPTGTKVVDFGVAAAAGAPEELAVDGEMWGTPAYLAPERLVEGEVTPASDVYALGLVLYRMVSGTTPWPAETVTEMLDAHRYQEPAPLPPVDGLPGSVADLCRRCLAKDPGERPTAGELASRLAKAVGREVSRAGDAPAAAGDDAPGPGRYASATAATPVGQEAGPAEPVAPPDGGPHGGAPPGAAPPGAAPPGGAPPGAAPPGAAPPGGAPHPPRRHAPRRSRRRLVLLTAAAVAAALAAAGGVVWMAGPADRRGPDSAGAPGGPSTGLPAMHTTGDGSVPTGPGAPSGTDARGPETQEGPGETASEGSPSPGAVTPEPEQSASGPPEDPDPAEEVVETPGGTVLTRCARSTASVEPLELAPGYRVVDETRGPGTVRAGIVLGSAEKEVRIDVRCRAGEPISTVESTEVDQ